LQSFICDLCPIARSAAVSDPQSHPDPHAHPKPSPDHELTPLETYFDDLFNQHMVLPQPPEEAPPLVQDVDDRKP
jgi:hypothetical protein